MICINRAALEQLVAASGAHEPPAGSSAPLFYSPQPLTLTPTTVTLAGILTAQHFFQAQQAMVRFYWMRFWTPVVIFGLLGLAFVITGLYAVIATKDASASLIIGLAFVVALPALKRIRLLVDLRQQPFVEGSEIPRGAVLNEQGAEFRTPWAATVYHWSAFGGYWLSDSTLVLGTGSLWYALPREHCASEADWLRLQQLVAAHLDRLPAAPLISPVGS